MRTFFSCATGVAVFCQLLTTLVSAEEAQIESDSIVVTASRLTNSLSDLARSVTIIDQEEILSRQAPNVTELLRQVAGLNIIQQGARGGVTSIVLRGGEPNFTVVMIDGVKVNDPTNTRGGSYDFSYLDVANIERIEIVRGPMSAFYGSDALAGVVNIITKSTIGSRFSAEVGGNQLRSVNGAYGGSIGALKGAIDAHALEDNGDIEGSGYQDWGLNASLSMQFGEYGEAGLTVRHLDASSTGFPEDSGGPEFAVIRQVDSRDVQESHVRLFGDYSISGEWIAALAYSHYVREEDFISPGIASGVFNGVPPNSALTNFKRDQLTLSLSRELSRSLSFAVGTEWQNERGVSAGIIDIGFPLAADYRLDRATISAFSEVGYSTGPLVFRGSVRWDDPEAIESETSTQLGVVYKFYDDHTEFWTTWGQGFKAPSFIALAHPVIGNSSLLSETASSVEVGLRRQLERSKGLLEISVYENKYRNLIDFDPVLFTNVNRSRVITKGVELSAEFPVGTQWNISTHLTYSDTEIVDSDARLRGRPLWRGGIVAGWQLSERWKLVTSWLATDEFYEVSIPTGGQMLGGYQRVDLALRYVAGDRLTIGFAIDNFLDDDYQEAVGFDAAGRRGRINLAYGF